MTTIVIGAGFSFNTAPGGGTLSDLAAGTVQSYSDSEVVIQGGAHYTLSGTGFAGDDGSRRCIA